MSGLERIANAVDAVNDWIGRVLSWLTLGMVLVTFAVVLMRYVFGLGSTILQETVVYMHALVFMACAGYALVYNGHVRCDIFYSGASLRAKAIIDIVGTIAFLIPMCILIFWVSWPYAVASWAVFEGSPEGRMGIPGVFLLKTLIPVFAGLLALQSVSILAQSTLVLTGAKSSRDRFDRDEGLRA
jgi:TRAP-type mannitol/chloroaromatic compound transport system permease small subunit